ncbi:UvrD-helicase domain-containing protein [Helcobacillus massiliensis]|uniref:UvrD-helicase domain-containing protein n=1 Tax=Helcobacillus massiliensis TaxID=521392 RepID=UPI002556A83F|nr:UvrD-helicase domain-containing protein [Helcobacillus massiliensis]MDK7741293.1 UvrD-helicase domain-containing protein [Helcobacillus massiliensis]WOO92856.1 UvrD-helicase domain-containing protein [Helcobacillus massiliensis]
MNRTLITASAGSGKTYTLTERIAARLAPEDGSEAVSPSGIIATTFTKRAAAEITERLQQKLLDRGMVDEAGEISTALIGTVNSVAGRIVTDYAIDTGLSPELRILDEHASDAAFQAAIDTRIAEAEGRHMPMLRRLRHNGDPADDRPAYMQTEIAWAALVKQVADRARANNLTAEQVRNAADASWAELEAQLNRIAPVADEDARAEWMRMFDTCLDTVRADAAACEDPDGPPSHWPSDGAKLNSRSVANVVGSVPSLEAYRRRTLKDGRDLDAVPWAAWAKAATGKVPAAAGGKAPGTRIVAAFEPLTALITPVTFEDIEDGPSTQAADGGLFSNPALRDDLRALVDLVFHTAADSLDAYREHKRALGVMDYVDQEVLALELITDNRRVRDSLAARFQMLAVDEFQDTSPIQLALFLALGELVDHVLWVGDRKQSIYGFRGAAPDLMEAAVDAGVIGAAKPLRYSYRSTLGPLSVSNALFSALFHDQPQADVTLDVPDSRQNIQHLGGAEFWTFEKEEASRMSNAVVTAGIANGVADLLERTPEIDGEAVRPRNVAVLVRANAQIPELVAALEQRGVPATGSAQSVLSTREGQVLRAGLASLLDAEDTLALIELVTLLPDHAAHTTWFTDLGTARGEDGPEDRPGAGDRRARREVFRRMQDDPTLAALGRLRTAASGLTPHELILALIDALDLPQRIKSWTSPDVRLETLDVFRRLAADYEERQEAENAPLSITGLIAHIDAEADNIEPTSDADAVLVTTVHQAKGLGWKVVVSVLPDQKDHRRDAITVIPRGPSEFDAHHPLEGRRLQYLPEVPGLGLLEDVIAASEAGKRAAAAAREEAKRVQYVSLTRSKFITVLTAASDDLTKTVLGSLDDAVDVTLTGDEAGERKTPAPRRLTVQGPTGPDGEPRSGSAVVEHRVFTDSTARVGGGGAARSAIAAADLPERLGPAPAPLPARITASSVPSDGVDADVRIVASLGDALISSGDERWELVGEAVHAYLAAPYAQLEQGQRVALAERVHHRWLSAHPRAAAKVTPHHLMSAGQRWADWCDREFPGAHTATEQPLAWWSAEQQEMEGWMDALLTLPDGRTIVVDHKTFPNEEPSAIIQHIRESHLGQMATYARALEETTGVRPSRLLIHLPLSGTVAEVIVR